jgi:hypothetical protein
MATPNKDRVIAISKKRASLVTIANEKILDLKLMPKDIIAATNIVGDFKDIVKINGKNVNEFICTIPFVDFDLLFNEATGSNPSMGQYITVLYIYFGVVPNDSSEKQSIFPIFQTARLTIAETSGTICKFNISKNRTQYSYDLASRQFRSYSGSYTANYVGGFTKSDQTHVEGIDSEAILIPFQEIYSLEIENNSTAVELYNAIQDDLYIDRVPKHSIIFSPFALAPLEPGFKNKIANRVNLCPVYCDTSRLIPYEVE